MTTVSAGFYEFIPFDRCNLHLVARVFHTHSRGKLVEFYQTNGQKAKPYMICTPLAEAVKHGYFVPLTPIRQI